MATLFLLLGYPGSGKTTFSRALSKRYGYAHVSSAEMRQSMFTSLDEINDRALDPYVFGGLDYLAETMLKQGQSLIYDANNNQIKDRVKSRAIARRCHAQVITIWVKTPLSTAYARECERRQHTTHIPTTELRYETLVRTLEPTSKDEYTIHINGLDTVEKQLKSFSAQFLRYKGVGTIFYNKPTDEFLFYKRDNKRSLPFPDMISIIGGYRRPEEDALRACRRTLKSELYRLQTGSPYTPPTPKLFQTYTDPSNVEQAIYGVTLSHKPHIGSKQGQGLIWIKRQQLHEVGFAFHFKDVVMQYAHSGH